MVSLVFAPLRELPNERVSTALSASGTWAVAEATTASAPAARNAVDQRRHFEGKVFVMNSPFLYAAPEVDSGAAMHRGATAPHTPGPETAPKLNSGVALAFVRVETHS